MSVSLFNAIGLKTPKEANTFAKSIGVTIKQLRYYNENHILPSKAILQAIESQLAISEELLMIRMGIFTLSLKKKLAKKSEEIFSILKEIKDEPSSPSKHKPVFSTKLGKLYNDDCIDLMKSMDDESVDLIFADPPFNLDKFYLSKMDDALPHKDYLDWSFKWIDESIRILKDGGSFYLWNLPKWNNELGAYLSQRLSFKHWIATDIKYRLPIKGRLYPSHYSLLYFTKGKTAKTFNPDRLPMATCNNCHKELKDYGGYKSKMNPLGINLTDVWFDIPPVRHKKYKKRKEANELSIRLLDRVIQQSSVEGDVVFDPFGGSGTTYAIAEIKNRKWIGTEIGPIDCIVDRFQNLKEEENLLEGYRKNLNTLFTEKAKKKRIQLSLWTDETFAQERKVNSV